MPNVSEAMRAALAAHQAGQLARAEQIYRAVVEADPELAGALAMLGAAIYQQGRPEEALGWLEQAVRLEPSESAHWCNLGPVCWELGRRERALACFEEAVRLEPHHAEARLNLAVALVALGRSPEALGHFQRAAALRPDLAAAHVGCGKALQEQYRWDEAASCFRRALSLDPDQADVQHALGAAAQSLGRLDEAEEAFGNAAQLRPDWGEARAALANLFQAEGRLAEALAAYRQAMELAPGNPTIHSRYLMCLHYLPGVTPGQLKEEHGQWERLHAAPLRGGWRPHLVDRDSERLLRLGFVSREFGFHTVGILLIRILEGLRSQPCQAVCYCDRVAEDVVTPRFKAAVDQWRQTERMSDEELAEQIRADRIDVLVDLGGHTAGNRLLVFARRPAPIQVTWLGYVGTTGLGAMDYLVADAVQVPAGAEEHYAERVLRMPVDCASFDPLAVCPPVGPLPAWGAGRVTFGSLNNPSKFSAAAIALWARVLKRVPGSRLLLRYRGLEGRTARRLVRLLSEHGISADRLEIRGAATTVQMLAEYNRIDVALDPLPYSGGLTTLEALWMGVPVITLPGATFASRHAHSHLAAVGMTGTIAADEDHYVELAAQWAEDLPRLSAVRERLRDQVARSPVCDGSRAAADFMGLVRQAWRAWTQGGE